MLIQLNFSYSTSHNKQYNEFENENIFEENVKDSIFRRNAPTVLSMFNSTFTSFLKYIPFISLLRRLGIGIEFLIELLNQFDSTCELKPKYKIFQDYFIKRPTLKRSMFACTVT